MLDILRFIFERMSNKVFRINKFITLKLKRSKTNIYINNEKFIQCKFLLLEIPIKDAIGLDALESVDEFSVRFGNPFYFRASQFQRTPPEAEFWGHCSNLQV